MVVFGLCVFAAVGLAGCPGTACFGIDTCRLQGTWEASVTVGSTTTVTNKMVITDDAFVYTTLTGGFEGTYKINALKDPKEIDFMVTRSWIGFGALQIVDSTPRTNLSIYSVSKDVLTVQVGDQVSRPVAFDNDKMVSLARTSSG